IVFCGKISEACKPCRVKRRKCNLVRPMCSSCINLGITCHGYRDTKSLAVRDQTTMVIQKEQKRRIPNRTLQKAVGEHKTSDIVNDLATSYFMMLFSPSSAFHYLPKHWGDLVKEGSPLELSMQALSLAALSLDCKQPGMRIAARSCYTQALLLTNNALSSVNNTTLDYTLLSVLLLSAFEGVMFGEQRSATNWTAHIQGTTTLLTLRGKKQLDSPLGIHLFLHAATNIRTSCAQRSTPVPLALIRLQEYASTVLNKSTLSHQLGPILDRFVAIKARLYTLTRVECIVQSFDLDNELAHLMDQLFLTSPYSIVKQGSEQTDDAWGSYNKPRHQYCSSLDTRRWNVLRMLRLFVNDWVCHAYACLADGDEPEQRDSRWERWRGLPDTAALSIVRIIDDIISSVPSSLEVSGAPLAHSVRFLIWPLLSIGSLESAPASVRLDAISILEVLSNRYDEPLAAEAASILETEGSIEEWFRIPADCVLLVSI
ncbi:hypothetical protein CI102_4153, partial [Trichoderma harzianum]